VEYSYFSLIGLRQCYYSPAKDLKKGDYSDATDNRAGCMSYTVYNCLTDFITLV
jgi:hypothetical protein